MIDCLFYTTVFPLSLLTQPQCHTMLLTVHEALYSNRALYHGMDAEEAPITNELWQVPRILASGKGFGCMLSYLSWRIWGCCDHRASTLAHPFLWQSHLVPPIKAYSTPHRAAWQQGPSSREQAGRNTRLRPTPQHLRRAWYTPYSRLRMGLAGLHSRRWG